MQASWMKNGGLALAVLVLLTAALRWHFIHNASQIDHQWADAGRYWLSTSQARDAYCYKFTFCTPGDNLKNLGQILNSALFTRDGIVWPLLGMIFTVVELTPENILFLFVLSDVLVAVMLYAIIRGFNLPHWAAFVGGLVFALYVPGIISTGTILQQPPIRFGLVLIVWAFLQLTRTQRRWWLIPLWAGIVLVGFISPANRPLIWVLLGFLVLYGVIDRLSRWSIKYHVVFAVFFAIAAFAAASVLRNPPQTFTDRLNGLLLGLNTSVSYSVTTPTNFDTYHNFTPDLFQTMDDQQSVLQNFLADPISFIQWWLISIVGNWQYPDYLYFQQFLLAPQGQTIQHGILVTLSFIGFAWWWASGKSRGVIALVIVIALYITVSSSLVSIEPRRLNPLAPFLGLGAALFLYQFVTQPSQRRITLVGLAGAILVRVIPDGLIRAVIPVDTEILHPVLIIVKVLAIGLLLWVVVKAWETRPNFWRWSAYLSLMAVVALMSLAALEPVFWYPWQAQVDSAIRQQIEGFALDDGLFPWLLVDIETDNQGRELVIDINGEIIKPEGVPLIPWETGLPPPWTFIADIERMANYDFERKLWLAYPVPPDVVQSTPIDIRIRSTNGAMTVHGDYQRGERYIGPSLDPTAYGISIWLWQWNGEDARIPTEQLLGSVRFTSSYFDSSTQNWQSGDLDPGLLYQQGIYRVMLTQEPFGAVNNLLHFPGESETQTANFTATCPKATRLMTQQAGYFICYDHKTAVVYDADQNKLMQFTAPVFFDNPLNNRPRRLIERVETSFGRLDLMYLTSTTFVLNSYDQRGNFIQSFAWEYGFDGRYVEPGG